MLHRQIPLSDCLQWRMSLLCFVFAVILASGIGTLASANSLQYAHAHDPLVTALSARSLHENSGANNGITSSRAVANGLDSNGGGTGGSNVAAGGGEVLATKTFPLSSQEPTCEQLRAMWIFSKRQSRAAEITNEIPTYRDPFAYNVWEPFYSTTRSLGSMRMVPRYGERTRSPVFGRVITSREPMLPQRINNMQRQRYLGGNGGMPSKFHRHAGSNGSAVGGGNGNGNTSPNAVAVQGSFQKLKELIWTERAKELTQQRRAEEMAARAAVLKEIANGQNIQPPYKPVLKSDSYLMDENRSPDRDIYEHVNDDHRTAAINIGGSQTRAKGQKENKGLGNGGSAGGSSGGIKMTGAQRSYAPKTSSIFSGNGGGSASRSVGRSLLPGSYSFDDIGIPKAYPVRPSHFRERNRSLFKQHSQPMDYFQRDVRQRQAPRMANNLVFQRLVNELNRRILEKQRKEELEDITPFSPDIYNLNIDKALAAAEGKLPTFQENEDSLDDAALLQKSDGDDELQPSDQYADEPELYDY